MIPSLVLFEHRNGQHQRQHFGADDGEPDAIHAEQGGQDEHRSGLKHQGAYRGDDSRDFAVVQGGEERGGVKVEAHQEIRETVHTRHETGHHEHGEDAVGFASVALAKGLGHQSASTRAQHRAYHANQEQERHHQVDGGEGRFAHEVGHEHTVNHTINRGENHHGDGGQREAQQLAVAEMLGEGDGGHGSFLE